jgi:hypothetical protein
MAPARKGRGYYSEKDYTMCHCDNHIHSFTCFIRNLSQDSNPQCWIYPDVKNAR